MTYIILGLWLSVSLLIVIVANAVREGETDDFINMVSFVWPIWLPILLAFLILNTIPVELGKYIGKKLREKQKAQVKTVKTETATVNVIENLEEENAKLRAELSGLKNYRGG